MWVVTPRGMDRCSGNVNIAIECRLLVPFPNEAHLDADKVDGDAGQEGAEERRIDECGSRRCGKGRRW